MFALQQLYLMIAFDGLVLGIALKCLVAMIDLEGRRKITTIAKLLPKLETHKRYTMSLKKYCTTQEQSPLIRVNDALALWDERDPLITNPLSERRKSQVVAWS